MIQVSQIKIPCGKSRAELEKRVKKELRLPMDEAAEFRILRHSVDARKKPELYDIYTVGVILQGGIQREEKLVKKLKNDRIRAVVPEEYRFPEPQDNACRLRNRPVIVGFGPAGIFCALELARNGYRPIVLERGRRMEERIRDVEHFWGTGELDTQSNIQFGEGGAGTFSDGKLNTGVKDRNGRTAHILQTFTKAGAPEDITYEFHPHIGTDLLRTVIVNLREEIVRLGGEVRFESEMTDLIVEGEHIKGVVVRAGNGETYELPAEAMILAPGHSARNTIRMLFRKGIPVQQKNFAVGFRVSHPQQLVDERMYGVCDEVEMEKYGLTHSSYKLTAQASSGRGVYSFCMCPGGYIVNASSEEGRLAVNGMSDHARDSRRANSAIIMTVGEEEFGSGAALAGMEFQERLEERASAMSRGRIPVESYRDFEACIQNPGEASCPVRDMSPDEAECLCLKGQAAFAELHELLPESLSVDFTEGMRQFEHTIPGFTGAEAYVCGLESRTSSPVRILRDESFQSHVRGLYPCGEGAGYAGGITSAAIDGLKVAERIGADYLPS